MHDNDNFVCLSTHDSSALSSKGLLSSKSLSRCQRSSFVVVVVTVVVSKDCFVCFIMVHLKNGMNVARV